MKKISIIGGGSYVALKLMQIIERHPELKLQHIISHTHSGRQVADIYPTVTGKTGQSLFTDDISAIGTGCDLVMIALPHGKSAAMVKKIWPKVPFIIDLGGDFRLQNAADYTTWYNFEHPFVEQLGQAIYGACELNRDKLAAAKLVANPGCYPTSVILGLFPLLKAGLIDLEMAPVIHSFSGVSGAGFTPQPSNMFISAYRDIAPYKTGGRHQHIPEIEQVLSRLSGQDIKINFTPHLVPIDCGILSEITVKVKSCDARDIRDCYQQQYAQEPFVRLVDKGREFHLRDVIGTNFCQLGLDICARTGLLNIHSAIDNSIKGAAGQAIQNLNCKYGFPETMGLV